MPSLPLNFSIRFDLTGADPVMVLTDTSSYTPGDEVDITGYFSVISPDNGIDSGSWASPDVTYSGGSLTVKNQTLRKASDGGPQQGVYVVTYNAAHPSYTPTVLSRTFTFSFTAPVLDIERNFDVFTPELGYTDGTVYTAAGYNAPTLTRAWSVVSTPTGTLTSTSSSIDLEHTGNYYDADYAASFTASLIYQHSTYSYLSVEEELSFSETASADTPPGYSGMVEYLSDLKDQLDALDACSYNYKDLKAKYEYASSLLNHITNAGLSGNTDGLSGYLEDFILVTNNYVTPSYVNTNQPIPPYGWGSLSSTSGGSILIDEFVVGSVGEMQDGATTYTNVSLPSTKDPVVFIDGLRLTYLTSAPRYASYNRNTKTLTINGGVTAPEVIAIYK